MRRNDFGTSPDFDHQRSGDLVRFGVLAHEHRHHAQNLACISQPLNGTPRHDQAMARRPCVQRPLSRRRARLVRPIIGQRGKLP